MSDDAWARSLFVNGVSEFLLLSPIRLGRIPGERRTYLQRVEDVFNSLASRMEAGLPTPLTTIPTIHFARWALIRPEQLNREESIDTAKPKSKRIASKGAAEPKEEHTWLLTAVVFDGEASVYSRELASSIGDQLDGIFGNCEGYPANGAANDSEGLWNWFRRYQLPTTVFHASHQLSVVRLRMLETFKARFDDFVASVLTPQGVAIGDVHVALKEFLRKNQQFAAGFPASGGTYPEPEKKTESPS
jgi:hypothetical protein